MADWNQLTNLFLRSKGWRKTRERVLKAIGEKCLKCGSTENIQVDHVVPRVDMPDGTNWLDPENLQPLCNDCNSDKGRQTADYRTDEQKRKLMWMKKEMLSVGLSLSYPVKDKFRQLGGAKTKSKSQLKRERKARKRGERTKKRNLECKKELAAFHMKSSQHKKDVMYCLQVLKKEFPSNMKHKKLQQLYKALYDELIK